MFLSAVLPFARLRAQYLFDGMKTAVVEAHFDSTEKILTEYGIGFDLIKEMDLESPEKIMKYDLIFFPCGIGIQPETSMDILSRGTRFAGVSLKDQYYKTDQKKAALTVRNFIASGGVAVFNDFSVEILGRSIPSVQYYDDFPSMGLAGYYNGAVSDDFASFLGRGIFGFNQSHHGWVVVKKTSGATYLSGEIKTPLGAKNAVISGRIDYEEGSAYFSSFHDGNPDNELMRFLTARAYSRDYIKKNKRYIEAWDLDAADSVYDVSLKGDSVRNYVIRKEDGSGTFFGFFSEGVWLVELYDSRKDLIYSVENRGNILKLDLDGRGREITVKILRIDGKYGGIYSFVMAEGLRVFPYYKRILLISAVFSLFTASLVFVRRRNMKNGFRRGSNNYL